MTMRDFGQPRTSPTDVVDRIVKAGPVAIEAGTIDRVAAGVVDRAAEPDGVAGGRSR